MLTRSGHGDVVRRLRFEIRHDAREHVAAMNEPALALPVEKAGRTFADELGQSGCRQRSEMGVRQMREDEHGLDITVQPYRKERRTMQPVAPRWQCAPSTHLGRGLG